MYRTKVENCESVVFFIPEYNASGGGAAAVGRYRFAGLAPGDLPGVFVAGVARPLK